MPYYWVDNNPWKPYEGTIEALNLEQARARFALARVRLLAYPADPCIDQIPGPHPCKAPSVCAAAAAGRCACVD